MARVKRTVQMYASITASTDAAATITIPQASTLVGVLWAISTQFQTNADNIQTELSINSARQTTTNDATGIVSGCSMGYSLATNGAVQGSINQYHEPGSGMRFAAGDKLYLHATESGGSTYNLRVILFFE